MPSLTAGPRDEPLTISRKGPGPQLRSRAPILLRRGAGRPCSDVQHILGGSSRTIDRGLKRCEARGARG